jgi:hypothetical protein
VRRTFEVCDAAAWAVEVIVHSVNCFAGHSRIGRSNVVFDSRIPDPFAGKRGDVDVALARSRGVRLPDNTCPASRWGGNAAAATRTGLRVRDEPGVGRGSGA